MAGFDFLFGYIILLQAENSVHVDSYKIVSFCFKWYHLIMNNNPLEKSPAKETTPLNEAVIKQAENVAEFAKIESRDSNGAINQRIVLYGTLRADHQYQQMNDPRLFAEVLQMLGDTDAMNKLKTAYHTNRPPETYCPLCGQIRYSENCLDKKEEEKEESEEYEVAA